MLLGWTPDGRDVLSCDRDGTVDPWAVEAVPGATSTPRRQGSTELSLILSETSAGYAWLKSLAFEAEPFDFKMAILEPEGAGAKGLYVDAISL